MDPIIPEKEERETYRHGSRIRPGVGSAGSPPTLHWPVGIRGWLARLAIPGVLLLLLAIQYATHSRDIDSLKSSIDALHASAAAVMPGPLPPSPAGDVSLLDDQLAQHSDLIRVLEQRLATQIAELDSLRNATSDSFALLGGAPLHGAGSLTELQESVAALKAKLANLENQVPADSEQYQSVQDTLAELRELPSRVDKLAQRITLAEHRNEGSASQPTDASSHLGEETVAELVDNVNTLQASIDAMSLKIDIISNESSAAQEEQQAQMAGLGTRIEAVENRGDDNNVAAVHDQLALQLAAIESLQDDSRLLAKALANTAVEIDGLRESGFTVTPAVAQMPPADDSRLNSLSQQLNEAVVRLDRQDETLNSWREDLESRLITFEQQTFQNRQAGADTAQLTRIHDTLAVLKKQHPFAKFADD